ncbi:MAG: Nudix family hydrolase [Gammaproteobacteria bacterium]
MAAGVLCNARGEILVTRRFDHVHQGGRWEFPGGKLESGEDPRSGLARELDEELGIDLESARPLIRVRHDYPDRGVLLDVWRVTAWQGRVRGREGQALRWLAADALTGLLMPAADVPVVKALRLPDCYLVTPSPGSDRGAFLAALSASVDAGIELVSLRAKELPTAELVSLCRQAGDICRARGARLLINADPSLLDASGADGVHLDSTRLMAAKSRPVPTGVWLGASCHDARQLARAVRIDADFAVLSPVAATRSHPQATPLGWQQFEALVEEVNLPVFALGGMGHGQRESAWAHGGQGIAAMRDLWKGSETAG